MTATDGNRKSAPQALGRLVWEGWSGPGQSEVPTRRDHSLGSSELLLAAQVLGESSRRGEPRTLPALLHVCCMRGNHCDQAFVINECPGLELVGTFIEKPSSLPSCRRLRRCSPPCSPKCSLSTEPSRSSDAGQAVQPRQDPRWRCRRSQCRLQPTSQFYRRPDPTASHGGDCTHSVKVHSEPRPQGIVSR